MAKKKEQKLLSIPKIKIPTMRLKIKKRTLVITSIIFLGFFLLDALIQIYFIRNVVSYSPKGIIVTKTEIVDQFFKSIDPTSVQILDQRIVSEKIIEKEAKKNGVVVTQQELDTEMENIAKQYGLTLEQLLLTAGLTKEELAQSIKLTILLQKLVPIDQYEPTEEEIKQFYDANKQTYFVGKELEEVRTDIVLMLKESHMQQVYGNWLMEKIQDYQIKSTLYSPITYKPVSGINYFLPILVNSALDTNIKAPLIKFDMPQALKK